MAHETTYQEAFRDSNASEAAFAAWMVKVNAALEKRCGVSSDDLPDCCYRDWHEDGYSPSAAAREAIRAFD